MYQYPYYSGVVLNDQVFLRFGGQTGSSTQAQRDAAYLLAESQMTEHLSSFLVPTIITGSVFYKWGTLFDAEFGHILRVLAVSTEAITNINPTQTSVHSGSAFIRNAEYGYVDVLLSCSYGNIHRTTMVYESGLNSGTVTQPDMLSALTLAAQINLNEWNVNLTNEGVADVGIQSFSNQSYSENRKYLGRTVFGSSPMAQRVAMLTKRYRGKPSIGFR